MKKMMMKERHSYIIRTALMAASGILLCGIAEAVRPEVDLSVDVPADKVVIADGILDQETQNDTDESFCDRLMKKMVHPIHMASRFLNGLGADSEEYVPSETEYNLMALRTEESAVDLSDPLAAFESLPWYKLAKRFRSMGTEDTWGAKMYEALGTRDAQWISEIYGWIQTTPLTTSQKMGLPAAQVLGSYDPSNPEHNAQDPASWVVPTWKNIRFQICDGDGKPTSLASNATDILSMANVYTYSLDWKNTDLFNTYINQLWTSSHQYHVSISNVYYCEGCTELPDEPATEETADDNVESGSAAGEASSEALDAQGAGDGQTAAEEPLTESEAASTANNYVKPAQGPGASTQEQAAESKAAASPSEATFSAESAAAVTLNENGKYCPGHVDLTITVKTTGLKEKHNLFALDGTGNQTVGNWQGWTEEKQTAAQTLAAQDWQEMYGLASSEFALGNPLTPAEIASYLDLLPEDLSPERRAVITCALNSVGKIPYYYGGKPSTAGLSGNHFASVTSPDYKGRILSGLDCSGWVNWVYWTALGNRMGAASTYEIVRTGRAINSAELQPGDLLVQLGGNSHVVMFLGWNADGTILGVHESGSASNVTVGKVHTVWPYYRAFLD